MSVRNLVITIGLTDDVCELHVDQGDKLNCGKTFLSLRSLYDASKNLTGMGNSDLSVGKKLCKNRRGSSQMFSAFSTESSQRDWLPQEEE